MLDGTPDRLLLTSERKEAGRAVSWSRWLIGSRRGGRRGEDGLARRRSRAITGASDRSSS